MGIETGTALLGASALGAGSSLLSSGKGGGGGETEYSPYADMLKNWSKRQLESADPLRNSMINQLGGFMGLTDPLTIGANGRHPYTFDWQYDKYGNSSLPAQYSPVMNAARSGIENAYNQGRQNIIGSVPGGGARTEALSGLESSRAGQYGDLNANIAQDMYNKAFGIGTNMAPAMSGIAQAGGLQSATNQQALMNTQMNNQMASGKGQGTGQMMAQMLMGKEKPWALSGGK